MILLGFQRADMTQTMMLILGAAAMHALKNYSVD